MHRKLSTKTFLTSAFFIVLLFGGFFIGLSYFMNKPGEQKSSLQNFLPLLTKPVSFDLEVGGPDDETISLDKSVLVSGTTSPLSSVIISTDSDNTEVDADSKGDFSKVIGLEPGLNHIYVNAFDSEGNTKEIERTVYYSEEKL